MKKLSMESLAGIWAAGTVAAMILLLILRASLFPYPTHFEFTEEQKADINARLERGEQVLPDETADEAEWNTFMHDLGAQEIQDTPNVDLLEVGVMIVLACVLGLLVAVAFSPLKDVIRYIAIGALVLSPFWIRVVVPPIRLGLIFVVVLAIVGFVFFGNRRPGMGSTTAAYEAAKRDYDRR